MQSEMAETRALEVLGWLLSDRDLTRVFLGASGLAPEALSARAAEPEVLASVLDFVLMDDRWVIGCATALGWPPERVLAVRTGLPGGDSPAWT